MPDSTDPSADVLLCDDLEKVFPDRRPRELDASIPLIGYRGERTAFQVAIRAERRSAWDHLRSADVTVHTPEGVRARVRAVDLVPVSLPAPVDAGPEYLRTAPGLFPDLLRPLGPEEPLGLPTGQWHAAWVDLEIDPDAAGGDVAVQVEVALADAAARRLEVPLRIVPVALPPLDIVNTHWFHSDGLISYYDLEPFGERYWAVHRSFLRSAAAMSVNSVLTPVWTPPLDTREGGTRIPTQLLGIHDDGDGTYRFDPAHLLHWLSICREVGLRHIEVPHLFTQWGARATPAIHVHTPAGIEQRFGWHVPATDPSYRRLLEQLLPYLISLLAEEWGLDRVIFHLSDEPGEQHLESYSAAKAVVGDLLADVTVVDAISSYEFFQRGLVHVPVAATDHARPFLDGGVDPLWLYYCVSQHRGVANRFIAQSSAHNRVLGHQLFLAGAQGFLHWGFNFYNSQFSTRPIDPFLDTSAGGGFFGGDAFMVYPGRDGEPLTSIRYEVFRDAMTDHRAARLLEQHAGTDAARAALRSDGFDELAVSPRLDPLELRRIAVRVAAALVG
jgi:hypothetical protein